MDSHKTLADVTVKLTQTKYDIEGEKEICNALEQRKKNLLEDELKLAADEEEKRAKLERTERDRQSNRVILAGQKRSYELLSRWKLSLKESVERRTEKCEEFRNRIAEVKKTLDAKHVPLERHMEKTERGRALIDVYRELDDLMPNGRKLKPTTLYAQQLLSLLKKIDQKNLPDLPDAATTTQLCVIAAQLYHDTASRRMASLQANSALQPGQSNGIVEYLDTGDLLETDSPRSCAREPTEESAGESFITPNVGMERYEPVRPVEERLEPSPVQQRSSRTRIPQQANSFSFSSVSSTSESTVSAEESFATSIVERERYEAVRPVEEHPVPSPARKRATRTQQTQQANRFSFSSIPKVTLTNSPAKHSPAKAPERMSPRTPRKNGKPKPQMPSLDEGVFKKPYPPASKNAANAASNVEMETDPINVDDVSEYGSYDMTDIQADSRYSSFSEMFEPSSSQGPSDANLPVEEENCFDGSLSSFTNFDSMDIGKAGSLATTAQYSTIDEPFNFYESDNSSSIPFDNNADPDGPNYLGLFEMPSDAADM